MTTDREAGGVNKPHVRIYLDDNPQPIIDWELPTYGIQAPPVGPNHQVPASG